GVLVREVPERERVLAWRWFRSRPCQRVITTQRSGDRLARQPRSAAHEVVARALRDAAERIRSAERPGVGEFARRATSAAELMRAQLVPQVVDDGTARALRAEQRAGRHERDEG